MPIIILLFIAGCQTLKDPYWTPKSTDISIERKFSENQKELCENFKKSIPHLLKGEVNRNEVQTFYYGYFSPNNKNTIFFLNGGPGRDSHASYSLLKPKIEKYGLNFIFIDQRGTGCSSPYPPLRIQNIEKLTEYDSENIAKDIFLIQKKLKLKKIILFAQSYGGNIAFRYLLHYPEFISHIVTHGASIEKKSTEMTPRLLSQYRVSELYFKKYPKDKNKLPKIKSKIPEDLCFNDSLSRICGPNVLDSAIITLGFPTEWKSLHNWIEELYQKEGLEFVRLLKKFSEYFVFENYLPPKAILASVLNHYENSHEATEDECEIAKKNLEAKKIPYNEISFNECRFFSSLQQKYLSEVIAITKRNPFSLKAVAFQLHKYKTPLYAFASLKDNFVPPESFEEQKKVLGSLMQHKILNTSGHEGFYTEKVIWQLLEKISHVKN